MSLYLPKHFAILTVFLLAAFAVCLPHTAHAQNAGTMYMQFGDNYCTNNFGAALGNNAGTGYTIFFGDSNEYDIDCARIGIGSSVPVQTDIRLCIQAKDGGGALGFGGGTGAEQCTPWASEGGGWSNVASDDADTWTIDKIRFRIDSRAMTGWYVTDAYFGVILSDLHCTRWGGAVYTPWMSTGGWSSWVSDADGYDFDCIQIGMWPTLAQYLPTTWMSVSVNGGAWQYVPSLSIAYNDTIRIGWESNNGATSCQKIGPPANPPDFVVSGTSGSDAVSPGIGVTANYTVHCANANGYGATDTIAITRNPAPPAAPTGLSASCTPGGVVSMSWSATAGATMYWPQINPVPLSSPCSTGWLRSNTTCYKPDYAGTSASITLPTNANYAWQLYAGNAGGYSAATNGSTISCSNTCTVNGQTINNGQTQTYYTSSVPYGQCGNSAYALSSTCTNNVMSPTVGAQYTQNGGNCPQAGAPTANLLYSLNGGSYINPAGNTLAIAPGDQIDLQWNSTNSTSCSRTSGPADFIVTTTSGTDNNGITEPTAGNPTTYQVTCTDGYNSVADSIVVTASSCYLNSIKLTNGTPMTVWSQSSPPAGHQCDEYDQTFTCNNGTLSPSGSSGYTNNSCTDPTQQSVTLTANGVAGSTTVRPGVPFTLAYNGFNSTSCTLSGTGTFTSSPSLPYNFTSSGPMSGTVSATITKKSVFTLSCTLGSSSKIQPVTVNVTPTVIEI